MNHKIQKGDMPLIGVAAMCALFVGWTSPDSKNCAPDVTEGYHVSDYFDEHGRYLGPDQHGVEPVFRDMSKEEIEAYLDQDAYL